ncbi:hypothetical protein [Nitrosospira multiformis]|uniref:hypothetical protein n=1 Tax=Nitrosospira multiformis TaxID=1231 RepID=UPI000D3033DF|nr:hypothetical protein [Nitrosospira multiformis]
MPVNIKVAIQGLRVIFHFNIITIEGIFGTSILTGFFERHVDQVPILLPMITYFIEGKFGRSQLSETTSELSKIAKFFAHQETSSELSEIAKFFAHQETSWTRLLSSIRFPNRVVHGASRAQQR